MQAVQNFSGKNAILKALFLGILHSIMQMPNIHTDNNNDNGDEEEPNSIAEKFWKQLRSHKGVLLDRLVDSVNKKCFKFPSPSSIHDIYKQLQDVSYHFVNCTFSVHRGRAINPHVVFSNGCQLEGTNKHVASCIKIQKKYKQLLTIPLLSSRIVNAMQLDAGNVRNQTIVDRNTLQQSKKLSEFLTTTMKLHMKTCVIRLFLKFSIKTPLIPSVCLITNMHRAIGYKSQCEACLLFTNNKGTHKCVVYSQQCKFCKRRNCHKQPGYSRTCDKCHICFFNSTCYKRHCTVLKTSQCDRFKKCQKACRRIYNTTFKHERAGNQHVCYSSYCKFCELLTDAGHVCYMKSTIDTTKIEDVGDPLRSSFVLDCETQLLDDGKFKINVIVLQRVLDTGSGVETHVFNTITHGDGLVDCFFEFLKLPQMKGATLYVHNLTFDYKQLFGEFIRYGGHDVFSKLVQRNNQIFMCRLSINQIRMKCTYKLTLMSLDNACKAFGVDVDKSKTFFPHNINVAKWINYDGVLPSIEEFKFNLIVDQNEKKKCIQWYEHVRENYDNYNFKLVDILTDYCIADCNATRHVLLNLERLVKTLAPNRPNISYVHRSVSVANMFFTLFVENFLQPNLLQRNVTGQFWKRYKQSRVGQVFVDYISKRLNVPLQCGRSYYGEQKIVVAVKDAGEDGKQEKTKTFYVDGYGKLPDESKPVVVELFGCRYHGHYGCLLDSKKSVVPGLGRTYEQLNQETMKRLELLRQDHHVYYAWECEFRHMMNNNTEIKQMFREHDIYFQCVDRITIAYGGYVETFQPLAYSSRKTSIKYVDINSLYPFAMISIPHPVGQGQYYSPYEQDHLLPPLVELLKKEGCVSLSILPPRNILVPILPAKITTKQRKKVRAHKYAKAAFKSSVFDDLNMATLDTMYDKDGEGDVFSYQRRYPDVVSNVDYDFSQSSGIPHIGSAKLVFTLCRKCSEEHQAIASGQYKKCQHSDEERSLLGTYNLREIRHALRYGYKIQKIYQAFLFDESSTSLFREYIAACYSTKLKASSYPTGDAGKWAACAVFNGIFPEYKIRSIDDFEENPGLRSMGKLGTLFLFL